MQDSKIARNYGISDSGSIRPLSEEDRAEMARDKAEREANKKNDLKKSWNRDDR